MKTMPAALARLGEVLVLRQEAVARMDRLRAGCAGRPRGCGRRAGSSPSPPPGRCRYASSASAHVLRARVGVGVHGDGPDRRAARAVRITRQAISPRLAMRILREHQRRPADRVTAALHFFFLAPLPARGGAFTHAGLRFSRNERMPSLPSSDARATAMRVAVSLIRSVDPAGCRPTARMQLLGRGVRGRARRRSRCSQHLR